VLVVLKPGWLYFLRDRDYRTSEVSDYVKIGLTRFDRPVEKRVVEHQTGNPREVFSIHKMQVNSINTAEKYLHHLWAPFRIHGEWFEMDEDQVREAIQQAEELNRMIEEHRSQIEVSTTVYNQVSNGVVRKATKEELGLGEVWLETKKKHVIAKNRVNLYSERLRRLMGKSRGIDGVLDYQQRESPPSLDRSAIKDNHPKIVQKYTTQETSVSVTGSFKPTHKNPQLRVLDESLDLAIKHERSLKVAGSDPDSFDEPPAARTEEIEKAHTGFLESLGGEGALKVRLELLADRVMAACGLNDGIEALCTWKRREEESKWESIDWNRLVEEHPDIAAANMTEEKLSMATVVKPYRPY